MRALVIDGRRISDPDPAYVIAEIGGNHGGQLDTAIALIDVAARAGCGAVKFQKRTVETLYSKALRETPYAHAHSYGPTYGTHRQALEFGWQEYVACQRAAQEHAVTFFATAFDERAVDFLAQLGVPAFKIHSGGLTDEALIRYVARFEKPVILSTGGGDLDDIDRAVGWLGSCPHAILHCTASYPLKPEDAHLSVIPLLRARYPETVIGWSSHAPGVTLSYVAYALGARILEHHITLDRSGKGTDHAFSLEPKGLAQLIEDVEKSRIALGSGVKRFLPCELGPISKMRRWWVHGQWQIGTPEEQEPKHFA